MRCLMLLTLVLLPACASSSSSTPKGPATQTINAGAAGSMTMAASASADVVRMPYAADAVWRILPSVFDSVGITVTSIDQAGKTIGNPGFKIRQRLGKAPLSRYLDCGNTQIGPNADSYDVMLSVMSTVTPDGTDRRETHHLRRRAGQAGHVQPGVLALLVQGRHRAPHQRPRQGETRPLTRRPVLAAALLLAAWGRSEAQQRAQPSANRVTVTGFAFDSLHGIPLADAFITIAERSRATTSDAKGKFTFDTLPPGTYTFAMQHAVFDSLGLSGATTRATVTDGKTPVTVAVPSFATLWRAVCGLVPVPVKDSGLVYGSIRDAKQQAPVPQASVEVSWIDLVNLGTKEARNIAQRRWKNESQGDAQGGYAVCGVPLKTPLQVRASYLRNATGLIDLPPSDERIRRRDLMVAGTAPSDSALRGTVRGVAADPDGKGIAGVRVIVDDTTETRTDTEGRFTLRAVRTGTRQVDFAAIGMTPVSLVVDITVRDTAFATATLRTVTNLEAVNITASSTRRRAAMQFDERRKQGLGSYLDSTAIGQRGTLSAVFAAVPNVTVQAASANGRRFNIYLPSTGTGPCLAVLKVDGIQQYDHDILSTMHPSEIAAIEVYSRRTNVPAELASSIGPCGVVAVWTKQMFR